MSAEQQQVFISHSTRDRAIYVEPIVQALKTRKVGYWLDSERILWGDDIPAGIHQGLQSSGFVLACLSENSINSRWVREELNNALAMQISKGTPKILPLILNSKEAILNEYPLVAKRYLDWNSVTPDEIAFAISDLIPKRDSKIDHLKAIIKRPASGECFEFKLPPQCTIQYWIDAVIKQFKLETEIELGDMSSAMKLRWILVEETVWPNWRRIDLKDYVTCVMAIPDANGKATYICDQRKLLAEVLQPDQKYVLFACSDFNFNVRGKVEPNPYHHNGVSNV
jgi:TIR domain